MMRFKKAAKVLSTKKKKIIWDRNMVQQNLGIEWFASWDYIPRNNQVFKYWKIAGQGNNEIHVKLIQVVSSFIH